MKSKNSSKKTSQIFLHIQISSRTLWKKFFVSSVYGMHSVVYRRPLWQSLYNFGSSLIQPWLVLGDFNIALNADDRRGLTNVSSYEVHDFMDCYVDLGLVDANYTSSHFTRTNNVTCSMIDRAMCDNAWLTKDLNATTKFLPPGCISDHSPLPFMFFNMWAEHDEFHKIVEGNGTITVQDVEERTEQEHFNHISVKVETARADKKRVQMELHDNLMDETLKAQVTDLQAKAAFFIDAERKFLTQKTKCEILLKSDKSTKLFHSLVKRNSKKNFIAALTKEGGTSTTSFNEVQEELLMYYGNLLGTRQDIGGGLEYTLLLETARGARSKGLKEME
ncbi:hypothetical protein M9H77_23475 [Catharanthus roseus]|uniref:Uncharacterized protein n=1 Tax=Catharanthus roseus TaxID=4058 RepID=A0ACC0AT21_CATRO|nr:hypothetical protein M9H77_23475 [Catharanthus roseus]